MEHFFLPVLEACKSALSTLTGETVSVCEIDEAMPLVTAIGVGGSSALTVWLGSNLEDMASLYEAALGMEADSPQELHDFLGEIANQTLGPAIAKIPGAEPSTLTFPQHVDSLEGTEQQLLVVGECRIQLGLSLGALL